VASKAIVGEKVGMTQVWDEQNRAIPVTVLRVAPARVVQVKTPETDGYAALQVTWGFRRASTLTKPEIGHFAKASVEPGRGLVELRLDDVAEYAVGQELTADVLAARAPRTVTTRATASPVPSVPALPPHASSRAPRWPVAWVASR